MRNVYTMSNLKSTTALSNSKVAFDATDTKIKDHAANVGNAEVSKVGFLVDVAAAYVAKELRFHTPENAKPDFKPKMGDHAEYAWRLWNAGVAAKLSEKKGKHVAISAVTPAKKSNLVTILRATTLRPDIVTATCNILNGLTDEKKPKTYEAIIAAATVQANAKNIKAKKKLTDSELSAAIMAKKPKAGEAGELSALVKKLAKMATDYSDHAAAYNAAAAALNPIVAMIEGNDARTKFFDDAIKGGFTMEAAQAFWNSKQAA